MRIPHGNIHAAALDAGATLCGIDVLELHEFGRSRYPFERFPHGRRCAACNEAAGWLYE